MDFQYIPSLELNYLNTEQKPDETEFLYFFSRQEQPKVMLVFNLDEVTAKLNSFIASIEEKIALWLQKVQGGWATTLAVTSLKLIS